MKKHLAVLLIAIMAVSVLSVAGVVTTTPTAAASVFPPPPPVCLCYYSSPNPTPSNPPSWNPSVSQTVNVKLRVSPIVIWRGSEQIILVTVLYDKKNFDPLMGLPSLDTIRFGHKGTEAAPIASYNNNQGYATTDVNHDGYYDLTFAFRAKDTGLRPDDLSAKLTGYIHWVCLRPGCCRLPGSCDNCYCTLIVRQPIYMTGTAFPVVVI
jgi:hypothetical protein